MRCYVVEETDRRKPRRVERETKLLRFAIKISDSATPLTKDSRQFLRAPGNLPLFISGAA
jgi:hypothetical protein